MTVRYVPPSVQYVIVLPLEAVLNVRIQHPTSCSAVLFATKTVPMGTSKLKVSSDALLHALVKLFKVLTVLAISAIIYALNVKSQILTAHSVTVEVYSMTAHVKQHVLRVPMRCQEHALTAPAIAISVLVA